MRGKGRGERGKGRGERGLMKNYIILTIKFTIMTTLILLLIPFIKPVCAQTNVPGIINGNTLTIYGGNNPEDTITKDWTAGSDNVVWDFGQKSMVYRLVKSLSLKYNPGGEFHIIRSSPLNTGSYKFLSFTGRADDSDLDFGVTFIDANNKPIGETLKFSEHGGVPHTNYWTQYNFPIEAFRVSSQQVSGIRISQLSNSWYAVIYLDEIYLSDLRGEYINPAIPSPTITPNPTIPNNPLKDSFFPELNPLIFLIPIAFMAVAIFFH